MNELVPLRAARLIARLYLLGLILALALGVASAQPSNAPTHMHAPKRPKPNIIFILADDLGYGELGCYGQQQIKTPNLDRMAQEGLRFSNFYAGDTVGAPSRCALMTGLHTGHTLVRGNGIAALRPEDLTVAELLKKAGYHTGLIGKWGLGTENTTGLPWKKGFDDFAGYLDQVSADDCYPERLWHHDPMTGFSQPEEFPENYGGKRGLYSHDLFTLAALNFVKNNAPDRVNGFQPFFLYLAYTIPHANNEAGQTTGSGMTVPTDYPYSDQPWPQVEKNKAAMITRLDTDIGRLFDALKRLRIDDNTVVFFSSDNGPHAEGGVDPKFFHSSGPLRGMKRDLYEGGIRVPLLVRWRGKIKPGVSDLPGAFWDFLPTAAEIAGAPTPAALDGVSLLPTLLGRPQTHQHAFLYWEFHEHGFQQAVRMGDWKAVRLKAGQPLELYDLQSDLGETKNVAAEHPEVVAKIEAYLKTARTESELWPVRVAQATPAAPQSARPRAQQ